MVISMETQLPAFAQKHVPEVLEPGDILVAGENTAHLTGIVLNDQSRIADIVFFGQIIDILPPVMSVKILDVHSKFTLDKLAVPLRDRRRKIIDVKSRPVDYRPDAVAV